MSEMTELHEQIAAKCPPGAGAIFGFASPSACRLRPNLPHTTASTAVGLILRRRGEAPSAAFQ